MSSSQFKIKYIKTDAGRSKSSYPNEDKDCSVRTLSVALGLSYDKSHEIMRLWGRKNKKCAYRFRLFCSKRLRRSVNVFDSHMSMKKFLKNNPTGTFIVHVANHALCVKDGVVYDDYSRYIPAVEWVARVKRR